MDLTGRPELLRFENVSKVYPGARNGKVVALQGITMSVAEGEFVSVIGPSGCGKSTLLRLSAGLDRPSSGTVYYRGAELLGPGPQRGLVFQAYNAFPWLTVRENVKFGLKKGSGLVDKVDRWLDEMDLTEFANCYPKALSGGMRQRLALARAMIVAPELLLLDEPFGALDERTRESMQSLLLRITAESGCTVMLATHDIREAILLSDRVVLMSPRPGRLAHTVSPRISEPRDRRQFRTREFNEVYDQILDRFAMEPQLVSSQSNDAGGEKILQ